MLIINENHANLSNDNDDELNDEDNDSIDNTDSEQEDENELENNKEMKHGSSNRGRQLYCRKCEGHGIQVILKGHTALCPYVNCQCKSCDRLMRMRKSAYIRRYKSVLLTKSPDEISLKPLKLFENANPRFALVKNDHNKDEINEDNLSQPYSFKKKHFQLILPTTKTDKIVQNFLSINGNNRHQHQQQTSFEQLNPNNTCRDNNSGFISFNFNSGMAPTAGATVIGPVMNSTGVVPGPAQSVQTNMISELPVTSAQREMLNTMLQAQNFNQPTFDPQQLAHFHALQQQQQNLLSQQTTAINNRLKQNDVSSPPKLTPALPQTQISTLRQKRPSQAEVFSVNHEPLNKRSIGNNFPQNGNFPLQQLASMNNPQQMALLQQMQQQNLPTSASMQIPVGSRPPQARLPFPPQGFPSTFNPSSSTITQNDDALQNYLRSMQMTGIVPQQRPQTDLSQLMALMAANNQPRANIASDDLKRKDVFPQISGIDQNAIAQQLAMRQDELRLLQMRNNSNQQQQQQLMQLALSQQQQQQQQQQNDQRRRSLPISQQPTLNLQLLNTVHSQFASQSKEPILSSDQQTNQNMMSPNKDVNTSNSTPSVSSISPNQNNSKINDDNSLNQMGPDEKKYQLFLHSIELFNKKIIEENDGAILTEKLNIPQPIVEAAKYTHLAKIQVPSPTVPLDDIQPGWKSKLEDLTNAQQEITNST